MPEMYVEYNELYTTYTKQYGPRTAVFFQVGSFYEIYGIQDPETGQVNNNARELADFLGLSLTVRKGDAPGDKDGLFSGFPDYALHKWAARLTGNGWTVVVVDQIKNAAGKVLRREVSRILSPSTHIEAMPATETPYLTSIYFEETTASAPKFGVATLDLTTGTTLTYYGIASGRHDIWTADDLVQFLSIHLPKEVICHWLGATSQPDASSLRRILSLMPSIPFHVRSANATDFAIVSGREDILRRTYSIKSMLPPKEFLGLRSTQEEQSLLYLLQATEIYSPSSLQKFHRNQPWVPSMQLICGNHAITQLQLDIVAGIFNACLTPMGKRNIQQRLLKPSSQASIIRSRLEEVSAVQTWPDTTKRALEKQLRFMFDIPRLHRKILCGTMAQQETAQLNQSYEAIQTIMTDITHSTLLAAPFSLADWQSYRAIFNTYIDPTKAMLISEDITPYRATTFPSVGETEAAIVSVLAEFEKFRSELAKVAGIDGIRLEPREKEPFGLRGSSTQLKVLAKIKNLLPAGIVIKELKSGGWIEHPVLDDLNLKLMKLREELSSRARKALLDTCQALADAGTTIWQLVEDWVSHVDCTQCIAKISKERGFVCPSVSDASAAAGASVSITGMRHPLVEQGRVAYVQHSAALGGADAEADGYLVYGMNASGKSTLMKAVGLCVLLAQAGCFVPARKMELVPFRAVYTRILNQDNIFAGLSSFAVEMSELRDILRAADEWSLVLGDELCSGTESVSAQALVSSGIQWLAARKTKYIFATHLHELPELLDCSALRLQVWHLHVERDASGRLIYDRSLRPGSGSTLYGLEVAKAMDLPFDFLEVAHQNRRKILGTRADSDIKVSSWNTEVAIKRCEMCGKEGRSLEVHHIVPRMEADPTGILPDGTPMNAVSNLAVLCQRCHDLHHAGKMEITKIQQTSEGPVRGGASAAAEPEAATTKQEPTATKTKSKWTEEESGIIKEVLVKYKSVSLKQIKFQLEKDYGIDISEASLRGIKGKG
jgi:DNA mismatch repair protein MutS